MIVLSITGCAGTPPNQPSKKSAVFYPALPEAPRIQFLTSFSGSKNFAFKEKSKFAEFVLGKEEEKASEIVKPYGVALHDNKLYVVDTRGGGFLTFDLTLNEVSAIRGMQKPINISLDDEGNKFVTDTMLDQINVFDRNDNKTKLYGGQGEFKPGDVAIVADKLYVTDLRNHQIRVLDKATGQKVYTIGEVGSAGGQLFHPTNLAIAKNGNILVSDTTNFRISEFTPDGRYVRQIGEIGTRIGKFARPKGIAVDREGNIYVVDAAFQNVQLFNADGRLLLFFADGGTGPGQLYLPTDIYIDYTSVDYFRKYAEPDFELEYIILISQSIRS